MRGTRVLLALATLGGGGYWLMRYLRPRHSTLVLNDQVVIITGASSGIGRALAFAFARRAARIVLVARRADRLEAVRREIEPYTPDVLVIAADITDNAQLQDVVNRTLEKFGRIDVLVNSAGVALSGELVGQDPAELDRIVRVNLWTPMRLTQLVLPHMLARNHGYILNVGSGLGRSAVPAFSTYSATQYGLAGFSDALRRELDRTGVYVTLVLPTFTRMEMVPPEMEDLVRRYGFRVDEPDDVAERAVLGLVHGKREIILGGWLEWAGVMTERYAPVLIRLYWKLWYSPEWAAVMGRASHQR